MLSDNQLKSSNNVLRDKYKEPFILECKKCKYILNKERDFFHNNNNCNHGVTLSFFGKYTCRSCKYESKYDGFKYLECEICDNTKKFMTQNSCPSSLLYSAQDNENPPPGSVREVQGVRKSYECYSYIEDDGIGKPNRFEWQEGAVWFKRLNKTCKGHWFGGESSFDGGKCLNCKKSVDGFPKVLHCCCIMEINLHK